MNQHANLYRARQELDVMRVRALYQHRDDVLAALENPEVIRNKQIEATTYLLNKGDTEGARLVSEAFDLLEHAIIGKKSVDAMTRAIATIEEAGK